MSGGDVAPLGEDAVNQLHGLFKWASRSKKGLLVFIDEAEAFLASRNGSTASETTESHVRNALNALLYQTGSPSTNFMLVLASNRPADMDSAILDRIDVSLHIDLPRFEERKRMIKLYKEMHVTRILLETQNTNWLFSGASMEKRSIQEDCNTEETLNYITEETDGFSGREISKLFIAIRYSLLLSPESTLTLKELEKVVAAKKIEHRMKQSRGWSKDSADSQNKSVDEKSKKDFKKKQKI